MKHQKNVILILLCSLLILCVACGSDQKQAAPDLQQLLSWMTGSFSSQEQSQADTTYFDIRLEMVRIWPDRDEGKWLYVEQAVAKNLDIPYRQRVYLLTQVNDSTFRSDVYSFDHPYRFAGEWRETEPLAQLTPNALNEREGCSIFLTWREDANAFVGSTVEKECISTLHGASYATSEVIITEAGLSSWDRGFNDMDEQVWGAQKGGYLFYKIEDR